MRTTARPGRTTTTASGPRARFPIYLPKAAVTEIWLSWRFIRNDPVGFWPGPVMTVAVAVHYQLPPNQLAIKAALSVVYFWLYLYSFCLTNQLAGQREDHTNKPFRPLVSGQAARRATIIRAIAANIAFPLYAAILGLWAWALVWQALSLLHNLVGWARNWVFKDFVIAAGSSLLLGPGWIIAHPLTDQSWRWVWFLVIVVFVLIPIQDVRDIDGDKADQRVTFPLAYGETFTRRFLCAGFVLLPFLDHFIVIRATPTNLPAVAFEAVTAALCWIIAGRIVHSHPPAYDHATYRMWEYWYILLAASAAAAL